MTKSAKASDMQPQILNKLVSIVSGGGAQPKLAKAGMEMHRLVDFYEPPRGYIGRLQIIRSISDLAIGGIRFISICRVLTAWRPYIDAVLADPRKIGNDLGLVDPQLSKFLASSGDDPIRRKGLKRHALEGELWPTLNPSDKHYANNLLLQAQMLNAQVSILTVEFAVARTTPTGVPDDAVYEYCYGACLSARRFSQSDWSQALGRLPGDDSPVSSLHNPILPEQYLRALYRLMKESKQASAPNFEGVPKETFREALGLIAAFIERGVARSKYRKRKQAGNGQSNHHPVSVTTRMLTASSGSRTPFVAEIVTRTRGALEEREELDKSGECPEDHLRRRHIILTAGGSEMAEYVRAAHDRANQLLPDRCEEPHPRQFERLYSAMLTGRGAFESRKHQLELMAWTSALFWLSCSTKQATNLMVGYPKTPLPADFDFFFRIADSDSEDAFVPRTCVRVIEPSYLTAYVPIDGELPREGFFEIADLYDLARPVGNLVSYLRSKGQRDDLLTIGKQAVRIFPEREETYIERLGNFIKSANLGFCISAPELGNVLFQRAKEVGDIVSADLITCKDHHLAAVRRWYFTPSIEHLRDVHKRAVSSVMADLGMAEWENEFGTGGLPKDEGNVCSRRCIDLNFLKTCVESLLNIVNEVVAVRTAKHRRLAFALKHNALTVLAVWTIDICIGMRGTTHLYLHHSEYDHVTGFGSITEKGKARAFQLCRSAREIAAKYDHYLNGLSEYGLPPSSRSMPCYLLGVINGKLEPTPATPSSLKEVLGDLFRFDPNWARRLVKTMALENGLPAIYTDQYCGHAFRGEERHHPFGSFDPGPYFRTMMEFTDKILQDIALTPESFNPGVVEPSS